MKRMTAWIVEYRFRSRSDEPWQTKISQEGYFSLETAQAYIESRPDRPEKVTPMRYKIGDVAEYYIYDISIRERR